MRKAIRVLCIIAMLVGIVTYWINTSMGIVTVTFALAFWMSCEATFEVHEMGRTQRRM